MPDWQADGGAHRPEAQALALDASLAQDTLGWRPLLSAEEAVAWTVEWHVHVGAGEAARAVSLDQIARYQDLSAAQ